MTNYSPLVVDIERTDLENTYQYQKGTVIEEKCGRSKYRYEVTRVYSDGSASVRVSGTHPDRIVWDFGEMMDREEMEYIINSEDSTIIEE